MRTCFTGFTDVVDVLGVSINLNVCRGGQAVLSNRGAAGCATLVWTFGIGYDFRTKSPSFWPIGCSVEQYRELNVRGGIARAAAGPLPLVVRINRGEPPRALEFRAAGGAPRLRVSGPGGERVDAGATVVGVRTIRVLRSDAWSNTTIGLTRPGTYRIEALPGSPAVTGIRQAVKSPPATVSATVGGRGTRRTLHYRLSDRPGQRVTFMELTSSGSVRPIGVVTGGGRGTLRFSPTPGSGRHVVEARFEIDGWPAERRRAARFRPPSPRLGRPDRLRVRRRGITLQASWTRVPGATRYDVVLTPSSGRQRTLRVRGSRTTLRRVAAAVSGRVAVRAVSGEREGPSKQARFRRTRRPDTGFGPLPDAPRLRR